MGFIKDEKVAKERQLTFRAAGIILLIGAIGLSLMRAFMTPLTGWLSGFDEATAELITELVFDVGVQIGFLFGTAMLVSTFFLKKNFKATLEVSNVRPVSWKVCLLAIVIGLCAPFMSTLVNVLSNMIFMMMGVKLPSSQSIYPAQFSVWTVVIYVVLVGVLPGICEEVFNRGIVLSAMRSVFPEWATVLLGGLLFGLFHQNAHQLFYTGVFGFVMTFIALKTRSIVPTIIVHFVNNAVATVGDIMSFYNIEFFSISTIIDFFSSNVFLLIGVLILGCGVLVLLLWAIAKVAKKDQDRAIAKKLNIPQDVMKNAEVDVVGGPLNDAVYYKPTKHDSALWWSALAVGVLSTVLSIFFNLL